MAANDSPHLFAMRRGSHTLHVVTNARQGYYPGQVLETECGVKRADVLDHSADPTDPRICRRCCKTLGWTAPPKRDIYGRMELEGK